MFFYNYCATQVMMRRSRGDHNDSLNESGSRSQSRERRVSGQEEHVSFDQIHKSSN